MIEYMKIPMMENGKGKIKLKDLFFFTDLHCNLECNHCYVGSSPKNSTLEEITTTDVESVMQEAENIDVDIENIYFTGGEPFRSKEILGMLESALKVAPVTVYTNGTRPLQKKLPLLGELQKNNSNELLLRVSFDHYSENIHNIFYGRDKKENPLQSNFAKAIQSVTMAHETYGLKVAITTQQDVHNNAPDFIVEKIFREKMFPNIPLVDVKVLPSIPQGAQLVRLGKKKEGGVSPSAFEAYNTQKENLMCHVGRTVLKYNNELQFFPCTILVPSSKKELREEYGQYNLGKTLLRSLVRKVSLSHRSCTAYCIQGKQTCGN